MRSAKWVFGVVIALLLVGSWFWFQSPAEEVVVDDASVQIETVGTSVEGRIIESYTYGDGDEHLLFVGGMHGGYEWNSVLLAYEFIDYLSENIQSIPATVTISIIPSLNPDGVYDVLKKEGRFSLADVPDDEGEIGNGRFNANAVDLNRNFDCKWQSEATWRGNTVSAGENAFSEPEAQALRDFVLTKKPTAVVFWHSQASAVYASECHDGVLPETLSLMDTYADASGYAPVASFDAYPVTGDAEGWLASIGIPAITVELSSHEEIEWNKNRRGLEAVLSLY